LVKKNSLNSLENRLKHLKRAKEELNKNWRKERSSKESVIFGLFISLLSASLFLFISLIFDYIKLNIYLKILISLGLFLSIFFIFIKRFEPLDQNIQNLEEIISKINKGIIELEW